MAGGMTARAVGAAYGAVAFGEKGASIGGVAVGVAAGVALGPEAAPAGYYAGRIGGLVVGMGYGAWRLGRIGTAAGVVLGAAESLAICR